MPIFFFDVMLSVMYGHCNHTRLSNLTAYREIPGFNACMDCVGALWMAAEPETTFLISSWMMARLQIPEDLRDHSKTRMEAGGF